MSWITKTNHSDKNALLQTVIDRCIETMEILKLQSDESKKRQQTFDLQQLGKEPVADVCHLDKKTKNGKEFSMTEAALAKKTYRQGLIGYLAMSTGVKCLTAAYSQWKFVAPACLTNSIHAVCHPKDVRKLKTNDFEKIMRRGFKQYERLVPAWKLTNAMLETDDMSSLQTISVGGRLRKFKIDFNAYGGIIGKVTNDQDPESRSCSLKQALERVFVKHSRALFIVDLLWSSVVKAGNKYAVINSHSMYQDGHVDYLDRKEPARIFLCDNIDLAVVLMSRGAVNGMNNYYQLQAIDVKDADKEFGKNNFRISLEFK